MIKIYFDNPAVFFEFVGTWADVGADEMEMLHGKENP